MSISSYQDLTVWQKGMQLAEECYRLTQRFPKAEMFGLTSQIRRAASSIPANIAEGMGKGRNTRVSPVLASGAGQSEGTGDALNSQSPSGISTGRRSGSSPGNMQRGGEDDSFPDWFFAAQAAVGPNSLPPYSLLAEHALLSLRVADIACGSGHILLAAAPTNCY